MATRRESQCRDVLTYMEIRGSITAKEAIHSFDCYRLSARIYDLRKKGHLIQADIIHMMDMRGKHKQFAKYTLVKP